MAQTTTAANTLWVDFLGAQVRYYDVNGARTRVVEAGSGPAVLLLHGLSGHAESFARNVVPFAAHFRTLAVDMLGHGFTAKPDVRYTIPTLAQHVLDLLDTLDIERASIVGQSLGGWVGCWLDLEHPERIDKLVLATGAGLQPDEDASGLATVLNRVQQVTQVALEAPTRESVRKRLEWLMLHPETVTDELVEVRYRVFTDPAAQAILPRVVAETMDGSAAYYLTADRLRRLHAPTYVFWTRHNPTVQWETAQRAAALIPRARWYLMENAAHWPQYEQPDEFNRLVLDFLGE